MRHCRLPVTLAILGLALAGAVHGAEVPDFRDLLSGSAFPLSVKLKALTPGWRRVAVTGVANTGAGNPAALHAALLHVQTLGSLTGIRSFDLSRELADSAGAKESHDALVEATQGSRAGTAQHRPVLRSPPRRRR